MKSTCKTVPWHRDPNMTKFSKRCTYESIDSMSQHITSWKPKPQISKQSIAFTTKLRPEHVAEPTSLKERVAEPMPQKRVESLENASGI